VCDCFKGTGDIVTEERQLDEFNSVFVEDNVKVTFQEDTVQRISVNAGKHLVKLIHTVVNNGELHITNDNTCNFVRSYEIPVEVFIHYKRNQFFRIRHKGTALVSNSNPCTNDSIDLDINGSGNIDFTFSGNGKIFEHQHGAGDITTHGTCNEMDIYNTGNGFSVNEDCVNGYSWVYSKTTGKVTIAAANLIICEIDGSGNVYYKGTPNTIMNSENSTGKLLPLQ
jgi:hypothetical protein